MMCIVKNRFVWSFLIVWFGSTAIMGQSNDVNETKDRSGLNDLPFRRVFVPQKELTSKRTEGFTPVTVERLESIAGMMRKYSDRMGPSRTTDAQIAIASIHYVARLVGPDLVSERSRLRLTRRSWTGERVPLRPFSLALMENGTTIVDSDRKGSIEDVHARTWTFENEGYPLVPAIPFAPAQDGRKSNVDDGLDQFFAWTARSKRESGPKKLLFSLEMPACVDSFMILRLPPQAQVVECSSVVSKIEDSNELSNRFNWPDSLSTNDASSNGPRNESLWLFELGGVTKLSFAVALGSTSEASLFEHLIRSERIEHEIQSNGIKTTAEFEMSVTDVVPTTYRIAVPPESRLRRLEFNQQEMDWQFNDPWIEFRLPPSIAFDRLKSEWFTAWSHSDRDSNDQDAGDQIKQTLPIVSIDRGYVLNGTTNIKSNVTDVTSWKINQVSVENDVSGSYINPPTTNNGFEYNWNGTSPALRIEAERSVGELKADILTRLLENDRQFLAVIRVQLKAVDRDCNETQWMVQPGWKLKSYQWVPSSESASSATISPESDSTIALRWDRSLRDRTAELELQLVRESDLSLPTHGLEPSRIIDLPGWSRSDTLAIEQSGGLELELNRSMLDALVSEESLAKWQRDRLPRLSQFTFLTMNDGALPSLVWKSNERTLQCNCRTWITPSDPIHDTELVLRHRFQITSNTNRTEPLFIALPSENVRWQILENGLWQSLTANRIANVGDLSNVPTASQITESDIKAGIWRIDPKNVNNSIQVEATFRIDLGDSRRIELALPVLIGSTVTQSKIRSSDLDVESNEPGAAWTLDETGNAHLLISATRNSKISVTRKDRSHQSMDGLIAHPCIDYVTDTFGHQAAMYTADLHLPSVLDKQVLALKLKIENDWIPQTVDILDDQNVMRPIDFVYRDGTLSISAWSPELPSSPPYVLTRRISVLLRGPVIELSKHDRLGDDSAIVSIPKIECSWKSMECQTRIWLPIPLKVVASSGQQSLQQTNAGFVSLLGDGWKAWRWWQDVSKRIGLNPFESASARSEVIVGNANAYGSEQATAPKLLLDTMSEKKFYLASSVYEVDSAQPLFVRIHSVGFDAKWSSIILILVAIVFPTLLGRFPRACWLLTCFLIVGAHLLPGTQGAMCQIAVLGVCMGLVIWAVFFVVQYVRSDHDTPTHRMKSKWTPWNESRSADAVPSGPSMRSIPAIAGIKPIANAILFCLVTASIVLNGTNGFGMRIGSLFAQEPISRQAATDSVYDILIPMDDQGNMAGDSIYVPSELIEMSDRWSNGSSIAKSLDSTSQPLSARHSVKLDDRNRGLGNGELIVLGYEYWVGDLRQPVRFPIALDQYRLTRFSADGFEISVGSRLRREDAAIAWYPERTGRHSVQLFVQRIRPTDGAGTMPANPRDESVPSSNGTMGIDIEILPVANAILDVDADSQYVVEIAANGRVTNPAIGKYTAMLGPINRIQCNVKRNNTLPGSGLAPSNGQVLGQDEIPAIDTELLLRGDTLQARTVVEYPKSIEIGREIIEMEADVQWQPIGTIWGDAQLIEVRSGSTLSRKRYVLEWLPSAQNLNGTKSSRPRRVSTLWIPMTNQGVLNVLFAECRDPRVRPGTLRYSREAGASWSIDGISTWIPAINTSDRLEWPELKNPPSATRLRIPSSGGFGILRRQTTVENQQARINSRWTLNRDNTKLTARIELFGKNTRAEPLEVELPIDCVVSDITSNNKPISFLQRAAGDKRKLQIFLDRTSLDANVFTLVASSQRTQLHTVASTDASVDDTIEWKPAPSVVIPRMHSIDQTIEIYADTTLVCSIQETMNDGTLQNRFATGLGDSNPIATFARKDIVAGAEVPWPRFHIESRTQPSNAMSVLSISDGPNSTGMMATLQVRLSSNAKSNPVTVLELPALFSSKWQSDASVVERKPVPLPQRLWLNINSGQRKGTDELDKDAVDLVTIQFQLDSVATLDRLLEMDFISSQSIPIFVATNDAAIIKNVKRWTSSIESNRALWKELRSDEALPNELRSLLTIPVDSTLFRKVSDYPRDAQITERAIDPRNNHSVHAIDSSYQVTRVHSILQSKSDPMSESIVLETRLWCRPSSSITNRQSIAWTCPVDTTVIAAECNSQRIPVHVNDNSAQCTIEHNGLPFELIVYSQNSLAKLETANQAETWQRISDLSLKMNVRPVESWFVDPNNVDSKFAKEIADAVLEMAESTLATHAITKPQMNSNWSRWFASWDQQIAARMLDWRRILDRVKTESVDEESYTIARERWQKMRQPYLSLCVRTSELERQSKEDLIFAQPISNLLTTRSVSEGPNVSIEPGFLIDPIRWLWSRMKPSDVLSLGISLMLAILVWIVYDQFGTVLLERPWWCMTSLALFTWLVTGWLVPSLILQSIATLVAIDGWIMTSGLFRRNGIRGLRSL